MGCFDSCLILVITRLFGLVGVCLLFVIDCYFVIGGFGY